MWLRIAVLPINWLRVWLAIQIYNVSRQRSSPSAALWQLISLHSWQWWEAAASRREQETVLPLYAAGFWDRDSLPWAC